MAMPTKNSAGKVDEIVDEELFPKKSSGKFLGRVTPTTSPFGAIGMAPFDVFMLFGVKVKLRVFPVLLSCVVSSSNSILPLSAILTLRSEILTSLS